MIYFLLKIHPPAIFKLSYIPSTLKKEDFFKKILIAFLLEFMW